MSMQFSDEVDAELVGTSYIEQRENSGRLTHLPLARHSSHGFSGAKLRPLDNVPMLLIRNGVLLGPQHSLLLG